MTRIKDFFTIKSSLQPYTEFVSQNSVIVAGDSLELLKFIPEKSVSLILTDPPYHSTKKKNIFGDRDFEEDQFFINWISKFADEWIRILKPNGSLFCFCSTEMSARLEIMFSQKFNVLSQIETVGQSVA